MLMMTADRTDSQKITAVVTPQAVEMSPEQSGCHIKD